MEEKIDVTKLQEDAYEKGYEAGLTFGYRSGVRSILDQLEKQFRSKGDIVSRKLADEISDRREAFNKQVSIDDAGEP